MTTEQDRELVFSLDGARGHYLTAAFLERAASVLEETEGYQPFNPKAFAEALVSWKREAAAYVQHMGGITCGMGTCDDCMYISESVEAAERELDSAGYVVEWNDGVMVYKVNDDQG